jgi:F-type H+-transporting ATPase subunit beta
MTGALVSLPDALDGCERILRDEFKDEPESSLYMIGAIDEAKRTAKSAQVVVPANVEPGGDGQTKTSDARRTAKVDQ